MEYHLDHRILLSQESEYKNLYPWFLQEVAESGEKIGSAQVPWVWSLYFSASEVRYIKELSIERAGDPQGFSPSEDEVSSSESINAVLHSGVTTAEGYFEREAVYSMLGTERQIQKFTLSIRSLDAEDSVERCHAWGCVSYTSEVDFRTETEEDILQFTVYVTPTRFKEYRDLITQVRPDVFYIRLGRVSGLYSEWSPSVSTSRIKVLTHGSEHQVEAPEKCEIDPPRLGEVGEFSLTAGCRNALELRRAPDDWDEENEIVDSEAIPVSSPEHQRHDESLKRLSKALATVGNLKWPIWFIAILLLLLFLK